MWIKYINACNTYEVLEILAKQPERSKIIAGGTDLILELEKGQRDEIEVLIDISRIKGCDQINLDEDNIIHIGPLVTHNACIASRIIKEFASPLYQAALTIGSPQIRNRGTVAGNIITASPANDTIPPLMALGARLTFQSIHGTRTVPLKEFYTGVRKTLIKPEEMLVDISFPAMNNTSKGVFIKQALRKAQAISQVSVCVCLEFSNQKIKNSKIALGSVGPTIIIAEEAQKFLNGKHLDDLVIKEASKLVEQAIKPISDIRSSADFRSHIAKIITQKSLSSIKQDLYITPQYDVPVLLWGKYEKAPEITGLSIHSEEDTNIKTIINGNSYVFRTGYDKSLLRLLREEGLLIGTKEGCGEGECGACTVFMDGKAVMSCLVPAPRAHGAQITTIEGISREGELSTLQKTFIEEGAVQCGYCTPGLIMSGTKLLEEISSPSQEQIKQAISGNLCRCTGYYQIIRAIENAAVIEKTGNNII